MSLEFEWPVPAHFELAAKPKLSANGLLAALAELRDGRRLVGSLVRFDPETAIVEFLPDRAAANINIGLSSLKSLRLTAPVELKPIQLSTTSPDVEIHPKSHKQKSLVHYYDGETLVSETIGFVLHQAGLFLNLNNYGDTVLRWFIPNGAIKSYQIGEQLGKILVDEKIVTMEVVNAGLEKQDQLRSQKLGDYLQKQNYVTRQHVEAALQKQKSMPQVRLGDALMQEGVITEQQLNEALEMQARDRKMHLGEILVGMKAVKKETISRVLAQKLGIPLVTLSKFQFDPELIKSVPGELVRKYRLMPLYRTEMRLVVAMENPLSAEALHDLAFYTHLKIDPVMAPPDELAAAIKQFYGAQQQRKNISELVSELDANTATDALAAGGEIITESDNALVQLVNKIIMDAYEQCASDIHIENMKGNKPTRVRLRKDGVMSHYSDIPASYRNALVSRLKIMSRLDISEKRRAQDGKINFEQYGPAKIELRLLTMPTSEGLEDVVMRILTAPKAVAMDALGLAPPTLTALQKLVQQPHGLFFVCGPTGSGKTTTLHSLLSYINTPERKIWTVEDPIEITQDGLRQVQVQTRIDWTFANVLRSFLRADPDVIMVGETRDPETARTVIEASLTGHLVFSTMHTNSAVESVIRLLDLGLDPFNFADALLGVLGQRLARRLCVACRKPHVATDAELNLLVHEYCFETELDVKALLAQWHNQYADKQGKITLYQPHGCKVCDDSGYKGRLAMHELLLNSAAIKSMIHAKANVQAMLKTAMAEGLRTIRQDGIDKVLQGHTDWDQVKMF